MWSTKPPSPLPRMMAMRGARELWRAMAVAASVACSYVGYSGARFGIAASWPRYRSSLVRATVNECLLADRHLRDDLGRFIQRVAKWRLVLRAAHVGIDQSR